MILCFLWSIITGQHHTYHPRVSADVILLLAALSPGAYLSRTFGIALGVVVFSYILIIAINTPKRRAMREMMALDTWLFGRAGRTVICALLLVPFFAFDT